MPTGLAMCLWTGAKYRQRMKRATSFSTRQFKVRVAKSPTCKLYDQLWLWMRVKVVPARDQEGNPIEKDGKPGVINPANYLEKIRGLFKERIGPCPFTIHKRFNIKRSTRIN